MKSPFSLFRLASLFASQETPAEIAERILEVLNTGDLGSAGRKRATSAENTFVQLAGDGGNLVAVAFGNDNQYDITHEGNTLVCECPDHFYARDDLDHVPNPTGAPSYDNNGEIQHVCKHIIAIAPVLAGGLVVAQ